MIVNLFVQWEGFIKFSSHSLKDFFWLNSYFAFYYTQRQINALFYMADSSSCSSGLKVLGASSQVHRTSPLSLLPWNRVPIHHSDRTHILSTMVCCLVSCFTAAMTPVGSPSARTEAWEQACLFTWVFSALETIHTTGTQQMRWMNEQMNEWSRP